jgi:hypothetical protein
MNLADVVPDGDVVVGLEPEELGLRVLQVLATWSGHIRQIRLDLFLNGALPAIQATPGATKSDRQ